MNVSFNRRTFLGAAARTLGAAALAGFAPGWTLAALPSAARTIRRSTWTMGTLIDLTLLDEGPCAPPVDAAFEALYRVDRTLSAHRMDSELSRLNRASGQWLPAGADLLHVSRAARYYADATGGALDVTVLPLMQAYGFIDGDGTSFDPAHLLERVDYTRMRVSGDRVRLDEGMAVDFGGIAKGYAVDEALRTLTNAGVGAALLEAGGDVRAAGRPEPDRRWRIGIRDPLRPEALFAVLEVEDRAVATSGLYMQKRTYQSQTVTHIINPKTGAPARHVLSATIVAPTAMAADALATATCVMEAKQARALIEADPETEGLWVYADGSVFVTSGLEKSLSLL